MSKKRCCDLCNNIIKTDYKKAKAKIKDVKKILNKTVLIITNGRR